MFGFRLRGFRPFPLGPEPRVGVPAAFPRLDESNGGLGKFDCGGAEPSKPTEFELSSSDENGSGIRVGSLLESAFENSAAGCVSSVSFAILLGSEGVCLGLLLRGLRGDPGLGWLPGVLGFSA